MIRVFVCIEIEESVKNKIGIIIQKLKEKISNIKWVAPENLHITLKFLGNVDESSIKDIEQTLNKITSKFKPSTISFSHIGSFPEKGKAKVIWIGIDKGREELINLQKSVEEELDNIGFPPEERPFSSHLTIGRVKVPLKVEILKETISGLKDEKIGETYVKYITLIKSTLTPQGPIYEPLSHFNLGLQFRY